MPRKGNSAGPPKTMTWSKAALVLILCVIFDALRFMFSLFWLFGPALAGIYCASKVSGWVGSLGGATAAACSAGAAAASFVGFAPLVVFGAVMAMAIGLAGWMVIGAVLAVTNARIFKASAGNTLWFVFSLGISEIPFVDALPAFTTTIGKMYATQIKKEKAELRKYEEEQAAAQQQERAQQIAQLTQMRDLQLAQDEQLVRAEEQEAENEEEQQAEAEQAAQLAQVGVPGAENEGRYARAA